MIKQIEMLYGNQKKCLDIDEDLIIWTKDLNDAQPLKNPEASIREVLHKPIGTPPLSELVKQFGKETIILVGISTLIAWPVAYFVMKAWLQNFYFRIPWSPLPYLLSLGIVLVVAWLSVSYQAFKASRTNPAEALRYE